MQITEHETYIEIRSESRFSARQTFTCGQCFRWQEQPDGSWRGIVRGRAARVWDDGGALCITGTRAQFDALWRSYFDCDTDYASICRSFAVDEFTAAAAEFGAGIRILNQEPWEALCTFLISQCNNIPRITAIVQRLCAGWGEPVSFEGETLHAFPTPEALAGLSPDDLAPLRAGYRAPYLIAAAQAAVSGALSFDALRAMSTEEARRSIMQLRGVGRKVADCFLLFGLHKMDAFPVDTWMKKAAAYYSGDMKRFIDSPFAGVYQQYFFYYVREHHIGK
ncbi:DNA-3-methyladenine glycosylase family protein [Butyricicoccus sp.]|uniref:DNA-3-methyladenine glycosylase family protein n=1 Tax=Butyricicoccus sp. TaxID=2049021 RepID=UPI003735F8DC